MAQIPDPYAEREWKLDNGRPVKTTTEQPGVSSDAVLRMEMLNLALRMPSNTHHRDVVQAAEAFEKYVKGTRND